MRLRSFHGVAVWVLAVCGLASPADPPKEPAVKKEKAARLIDLMALRKHIPGSNGKSL